MSQWRWPGGRLPAGARWAFAVALLAGVAFAWPTYVRYFGLHPGPIFAAIAIALGMYLPSLWAIRYLDAPHPTLPGAKQGKWLTIAVPGHSDAAGRTLSFDAAAGVVIPEGFAKAIYLLLGPGATMLVTDAPILAENTTSGTELISGRSPDSASQ